MELFGKVLFVGGDPLLCDEGMARMGRMDTVNGPMLVIGDLERLVKDGLQGDEGNIVFLCKTFHDLGTGADLGEEGIVMLIGGGAVQQEGLHQHEFDTGKLLAGLLDEHAKHFLKALGRNAVAASKLMPDIVDSDEDRDHIGLELDAVSAPAGVEIDHAVAADTAAAGRAHGDLGLVQLLKLN